MKKSFLSFCIAAAAAVGLACSAIAAAAEPALHAVGQFAEAQATNLVQAAKIMPGVEHRQALALQAFAAAPPAHPGVRTFPVATSATLRGTPIGPLPPEGMPPTGLSAAGRSSPHS